MIWFRKVVPALFPGMARTFPAELLNRRAAARASSRPLPFAGSIRASRPDRGAIRDRLAGAARADSGYMLGSELAIDGGFAEL